MSVWYVVAIARVGKNKKFLLENDCNGKIMHLFLAQVLHFRLVEMLVLFCVGPYWFSE